MTMQAGVGLNVNTEREIVNHRKLLHLNVIRYVIPKVPMQDPLLPCDP